MPVLLPRTADESAVSETGSMTIEFPADQTGDLALSDDSGQIVSVSLPQAETAQPATISEGNVAYDNGNGSHTVTSLDSEGALTALTVIESPSAPDSYAYEIKVDEGGWLELQADGSVWIINAEGAVSGLIETPWAIDANGDKVPTSYEVSGSTLTQRIDLSSPSIHYPVVADPKIWAEWWGTVVLLSKSETKWAAGKAGYKAVTGAACGYIPIVHVRAGCIALVAAKAINLSNVTREASSQGRCLAINVPAGYWAGPGGSYLGMNFTNVKCQVK